MNNTLINKTFYSEYFDDNVKDIYLLDKNESSKLWSLYVDKTANSFFKLSDNNPIIFNSKSVGDWREYYDTDNVLGLQNFLTSLLNWKKEEFVLFCINKETIIKTSYEIFLDNIFNFLELCDDCPILINLDNQENLECIYFASLGNTFYSPATQSL